MIRLRKAHGRGHYNHSWLNTRRTINYGGWK